MIRLLMFVIAFLGYGSSIAQESILNFVQDPLFNPAHIAGHRKYELSNQFLTKPSISQTPLHFWTSVNVEFPRAKSIIGLLYHLEKQSNYIIDNELRINYATRLRFGKHSLVPAVYLSFLNRKVDNSESVGANPAVILETRSYNGFDLGLGFTYDYDNRQTLKRFDVNRIRVGFGFTDLVSHKVDDWTILGSRFLHATAMLDVKLGKIFRLTPKLWLKSDYVDLSPVFAVDAGLEDLGQILNRWNLGGGVRLNTTGFISTEFIFKWLSLGYSYQFKSNNVLDERHQVSVNVYLFDLSEAKPNRIKEDYTD